MGGAALCQDGFEEIFLKALAFLLLGAPFLWLLGHWLALALGEPLALGANPVEATIRFLGDTALRVLLVTLAIRPLAQSARWPGLIGLRRMAGLYALFYASLHFLAYFGMDRLGSFALLGADIAKRNYITVGITAFLLLIPLGLTSSNAMVRRLGARRWRRLHQLVYPIAILAVFHHAMMVKGNQLMPWLHAGLLTLLLLARIAIALKHRWRGRHG